jgi:hypothetical protein
MTSQEITQLPLGTKVYLIVDAKIIKYRTIGFNPRYSNYFYLQSDGSVSDVQTLYIDSQEFKNSHWETDYEKAKEVMWKQLKERVKSINDIYFENKMDINFNND